MQKKKIVLNSQKSRLFYIKFSLNCRKQYSCHVWFQNDQCRYNFVPETHNMNDIMKRMFEFLGRVDTLTCVDFNTADINMELVLN